MVKTYTTRSEEKKFLRDSIKERTSTIVRGEVVYVGEIEEDIDVDIGVAT